MALVLFGTLFCLLVTGSLSTADIPVGTACTAADTCIANAVCDKVHGKCLNGTDTVCTKASANTCVFGASCKDTASTGTANCDCDAGFKKKPNDKICEADVGTPCNESVTCVSSFTWDAVLAKCLLKVEQSCKGNERNCVSGATCEADLCTCGAGYTIQTDKTCRDDKAKSSGSFFSPLLFFLAPVSMAVFVGQ